MPVDDQGQPVTPVKVEVKCEKCGGPMGVKRGKRGAFLGCLNYPKCRSTQPIPDELKDQLGEAPGAATSAAKKDLKAIVCGETCKNCGGTMTVREGRRGYLPRLCQLPEVQGDEGTGRSDHGKDQRDHRAIDRVEGASFALKRILSPWPELICCESGHPTFLSTGMRHSDAATGTSRSTDRPPVPTRRRGLRSFLDAQAVAYEYKDVDESPELNQYLADLNQGKRVIPTIRLNNTILIGPSEHELSRELQCVASLIDTRHNA